MKRMKIKNSNKAKAPIAKKIPATLEKHEDKREDPYYWLRERENPAVSEYLNAENAYTETILKEAETFQHHLFEEMKGRIKQKDASAPYRDNGYYYQTRFDEGTEYAIYYRKADEAEAEYKELLNINKLAEAHAYYDESSLEVSPNNQLLAFGEDTVSRRIYTLRIKNIETGTFLEDVIPGTTGSYAWSADNQYIFYTLRDPETLRPIRSCGTRSVLLRKPMSPFLKKPIPLFPPLCIIQSLKNTWSLVLTRPSLRSIGSWRQIIRPGPLASFSPANVIWNILSRIMGNTFIYSPTGKHVISAY